MVYIMNRCKKCNVNIIDNTLVCPLCQNVVEVGKEPNINTYPDVSKKTKVYHLIVKIFIFSCIFTEMLLILINYITYSGLWWSIICGGAMVYLCFSMYYTVTRNTGHVTKIIVETVGAIILAVLIDYTVGWKAWSITYAIPCAIMLIDLFIVIMMFIYITNWQRYIIYQIFIVVLSIIPVVLGLMSIITNPFLSYIAAIASFLMLIGTLIIGDKKATTELSRRFRI